MRSLVFGACNDKTIEGVRNGKEGKVSGVVLPVSKRMRADPRLRAPSQLAGSGQRLTGAALEDSRLGSCTFWAALRLGAGRGGGACLAATTLV